MILDAYIPEDIEQWRGEWATYDGVKVITFRRNGVTLVVKRDSTRWYKVVEMQGGKVSWERAAKRIPTRLDRAILNARAI